jgi:hypothetical protein
MLRGCYAKIAIPLVCIFAAGCATGRLLNRDDGEQQGWHNFQTAVADDGRNYDVYWMGREFDVAGQTLRGPSVSSPDQIGQIEGGGLSISYQADESRDEFASLDIRLYSTAAWALLQKSRSRGAQPRLDVKQEDIHGWSAELKTNYYRPGYVAARILVVDLGRSVIEVSTGSVVPRTPGPEPNPLIDEQTFLAAMQHLRPYPQ